MYCVEHMFINMHTRIKYLNNILNSNTRYEKLKHSWVLVFNF